VTLLETVALWRASPGGSAIGGSRLMRRIALIVSAMLAVVLSVPVSAASGWSPPQQVWDAAYDSPSMVADASGAVHVAARGGNGLWYLTNETGRWTRVRLTRDRVYADRTETARSPVIALDPWDGSLTVVFAVHAGDCCPGSISLSYVTDRHAGGPGAWSRARSIPYQSAADPSPSVVVRHGVIAIAAAIGTYDATQVEFLTNVTGRWTHEVIRATGQRWAGEPSLALDRQGRPVIAYQVHGAYPKADAIRIAQGTRRSGGFGTARVVALPGSTDPSLVLDAKGGPRIGFDADDGTYVARRTASGWRLRLVWRNGSDDELLLGRDGRSRVVGLRQTARSQVWYAKWSAGAWQRTRLTTHPARQVTFAVGKADGRDHVAYVVGDRLWYTHTR
jgi:hypothetical protein